jgi:hypothetical protein
MANTTRDAWADRPSPAAERQDWHTQARERDEAYLAEGPVDMTETNDPYAEYRAANISPGDPAAAVAARPYEQLPPAIDPDPSTQPLP